LRELIEAKMKGLTIEPRAVSTPSPVIDLMAALKTFFAPTGTVPAQGYERKRTKQAADRRQPALLLLLNRRSQRKPTALGRPGCR
jgi:non-homologous end joining protein Ku